MIETIVATVASLASISGVTLKSLLRRHLSDHAIVKSYVKWLEGKKVLYAPFDREVHIAVVKSIETIKAETEAVRSKISDELVSLVFLHLVLRMSEQLMELHALDSSDPRHAARMYRSIQEVRAKFASALALLCESHKISLSGSTLAPLVADLGFRQRRE